MKKRTIIISTGLAIIGAISFVGCSQEKDYMFDTDLSIDSQVPMTRSGGEQDFWKTKNPNEYSYDDNECCLVALVEIKRQDKSFTENYPASKFYTDIKEYAMSLKDENDNPKYTGGAMAHDVFLDVAKEYGLLSEEKKFSNGENKLQYL